MSTIDSYLASVRYRLAALPDAEQEEIMSEIQAHLEDKAASLLPPRALPMRRPPPAPPSAIRRRLAHI